MRERGGEKKREREKSVPLRVSSIKGLSEIQAEHERQADTGHRQLQEKNSGSVVTAHTSPGVEIVRNSKTLIPCSPQRHSWTARVTFVPEAMCGRQG